MDKPSSVNIDKPRSASFPHIKFEFPRKPFPHFAIHTRVMQFGWRKSGRFALWFAVLLFIAILVPYTIALARGHVKPLLPLISETGGVPPENGIYSIALYIASIVGITAIVIRYVVVSSENEAHEWRMAIFNKLALGAGLISFVGMIIIASYPLSTCSKQEEWKSAVWYPHLFGAFCLFFFGAVYLLLQTAISMLYCKGHSTLVAVRCFLFLLCATCFVTSSLNHVSVMEEKESEGLFNGTFLMTDNGIHSSSRIISSVCEWIMVFLFAVYFTTFFRESQRVSVAITFRTLATGRKISLASLGNMAKI